MIMIEFSMQCIISNFKIVISILAAVLIFWNPKGFKNILALKL